MTSDKLIRISALLVVTLLIISLTFVVLSRLLVESPDTLDWLWQSVLKVTGTSLLAGAIVAGLGISWDLLSNFRKSARIISSTRTQITFFALVLLGLTLPIVLLLFKDTFLPFNRLAIYVWELWLSVAVLISVVVILRILVRWVPGFRELGFPSQAINKALTIWVQDKIELYQAQKALDEALVALEQGVISEDQAREMEQTSSLIKWMLQENDTGWHELREEARFGTGLTAAVQTVVEQELQRVSREKLKSRERPSRSGEYEKQLRSLLSPQQA